MPGPLVFSRLFEAHRDSVVRYARRRLGDDDAQDAAVEVFGRVMQARPHDHARYGSARAWLYALATEAVAERWRSERRRLEALERHARHPPARHPALGATRSLDPRVANLLRCLPASDRDTLLLVTWGELTVDESAASLGVPVTLVRDRLSTVHAQVVGHAPGDDARGPGVRRAPSSAPAVGLPELLGALADNADLGLDPVRQPRIESAVSRRFATAPPHWSPRGGEPQFLGT